MAEQQSHEPPDDVWRSFRAAEGVQETERLEGWYRTIEGQNARSLHQVVGLEDLTFTDQEPVGTPDYPDDDTKENKLRVHLNPVLLQPDRRQEYIDYGVAPETAHLFGDPYVIRGEVPPRTQKLIEDLFASTNAKKDDKASTLELEVWRGDVAGEPVEFDVYRFIDQINIEGGSINVPTLSIRVVGVPSDTTKRVEQEVAERRGPSVSWVNEEEEATTEEDSGTEDDGSKAEQASSRRIFQAIRRKFTTKRRRI